MLLQIVWDVGHQAYGHKILTGRRNRMSTIRQTGGLSGAILVTDLLHLKKQTLLMVVSSSSTDTQTDQSFI